MTNPTKYLYAAFWAADGKLRWGMMRNGRAMLRAIARRLPSVQVEVRRMPMPATGLWDSRTFRICSDPWRFIAPVAR